MVSSKIVTFFAKNIIGKGWILYSQGNWYDGEWFEDERHGLGLRQYEYQVRYKGQWSRNMPNGEGSMLYCNTDVSFFY